VRAARRCRPRRRSPRRRVPSGARRTGATGASGIYKPVAESVGLAGARPYDLRHAFASLLIHEGRLSVVEIAAQLGHNPTVCLDTYAHVMAEERDGEHVSAEEQIVQAREALLVTEADGEQLALDGFGA
jgi:integrase